MMDIVELVEKVCNFHLLDYQKKFVRKVYLFINYSVHDTTISITLGSCFEANKNYQSQ